MINSAQSFACLIAGPSCNDSDRGDLRKCGGKILNPSEDLLEQIPVVNTTLRDGHTSLWAHNMTTGMMHPVLRHMDQAGFDGMEFFVSGRFNKVVREQLDNPWDWVRYGKKEVKNTQLRYHGGLSSGFSLTPACIPRLVIERIVHYGITTTRLSDPWNDYDELKNEIVELRKLAI